MDSTYIGRSAGAAGIATLHQSETASRQATSIEVAHATLEEARQLAFRVFDVVERLCGCQPEPTADPSKGGNFSLDPRQPS